VRTDRYAIVSLLAALTAAGCDSILGLGDVVDGPPPTSTTATGGAGGMGVGGSDGGGGEGGADNGPSPLVWLTAIPGTGDVVLSDLTASSNGVRAVGHYDGTVSPPGGTPMTAAGVDPIAVLFGIEGTIDQVVTPSGSGNDVFAAVAPTDPLVIGGSYTIALDDYSLAGATSPAAFVLTPAGPALEFGFMAVSGTHAVSHVAAYADEGLLVAGSYSGAIWAPNGVDALSADGTTYEGFAARIDTVAGDWIVRLEAQGLTAPVRVRDAALSSSGSLALVGRTDDVIHLVESNAAESDSSTSFGGGDSFVAIVDENGLKEDLRQWGNTPDDEATCVAFNASGSEVFVVGTFDPGDAPSFSGKPPPDALGQQAMWLATMVRAGSSWTLSDPIAFGAFPTTGSVPTATVRPTDATMVGPVLVVVGSFSGNADFGLGSITPRIPDPAGFVAGFDGLTGTRFVLVLDGDGDAQPTSVVAVGNDRIAVAGHFDGEISLKTQRLGDNTPVELPKVVASASAAKDAFVALIDTTYFQQ
jgi:hypothetical protein